MLCLMQKSESEKCPSTHNSLTHIGKPTQVWVYIGKHPRNSTVEYLNVTNKLSNK